MRVFGEGYTLRRIIEEARESVSYFVCLLEGEIPDVVNVFRRIEPRLLLRLERDIRPGLMRMTSEENPLGDAETLVVLGEPFRIDHSSERIAHKSGNAS
jgi:hypothetical protein